MKIGILGSGNVAQSLAAGLLAHGHDVMLGTRDAAKLRAWAAAHPKATVGGVAEAAAFGEMVVLAVKGSVAADVLRSTGRALEGKTVLDTTNPIADEAPVNGVLKFFTSLDDSLMEQLQRAFPEVRFVKAFNSIGHAFMVNPRFAGGPPTMFICGNDPAAKQEVTALVQAFGFEPADMGAAEAARAIEPLCILWCIPGFQRQEWAHAFKLLKA